MAGSPAGVLMLAPEREPLEAGGARDRRRLPRARAARCSTRRPCGSWSRPWRPGCGRAGSRRATRSGRSPPHARSRGARTRPAPASTRPRPRGRGWPAADARGVLSAGVRRPAGAVIVAAGPWTPEVIDPTRAWRPIVPVWGVVADVDLPDPPGHVLEEAGVEARGRRRRERHGPGRGAVQPGVRRRARVARLDVPARPPEPGAVGGPAAPGRRQVRARAPERRGRRPPDLRAAAVRRRAAAPRRGARRRRASGWPPATARGGSRPARRAPASWRTPCSGGPRSPSRCR